MPSVHTERCKNCKSEYPFYASGMAPEHNDPNYCPECKKAVDEALSRIKPKYKRVFVPVKDAVLATTLVNHIMSRPKGEFYRIYMPEFDMTTGEALNQHAIRFEGAEYCVGIWEKGIRPPEVTMETWEKIIKG